MLHALIYSRGVMFILASAFSSIAQTVKPLGSAEKVDIFYYNVRGPLELHCKGIEEDSGPIIWKKNGTPVDRVSELNDRMELKNHRTILKIKGRSNEDDYGEYTCSAGAASHTWEVRGRPRAKIPANSFVTEEENVKIICKLIGKPYPVVRWLYSNTSEKVTKETPEAQTLLGKRVMLANSTEGVVGAELTLRPAQLNDEGWYTCIPVGEGVPGTMRLRVNSKYAAMWPFLGICVEVLLLCVIILRYEKRYKKTHRLDNNDTDHDDEKQ